MCSGCVPRPAGLHVLVGLEAATAGQLEVDLVLEEHDRLAEQLSAGALQRPSRELPEALVVRQHVLHAIQDPLAGAALLEIHHVPAGSLRPTLHLVGPAADVPDLSGCE